MKNGTIVIETQFLYDYNYPEKGITVGGTQRYALELGNLIRELNYDVVFITKAKINSEITYDDFGKVISYNSKFGNLGNSNFSKRVYNYANKIKADLVIYSDILVSLNKKYEKSIAIQHGIAWDNPYENKLKSYILNKQYIKATLKHDKVVCVDTNFINWMREKSKKYFKKPDRLIYIPNFADESNFSYSTEKYGSLEYKLLYPRRLVKHRGFNIFTEMCLELINEGFNVVPVYAIDESNKDILYSQYPKLKDIKHILASPKMSKIHEYYSEAYLTFVPTIWSEGTSLSAIESIMSGCPVIVSDVGGLSNIVIDGFNGYVLPPTIKAFKEKTKEIITNPALRDELKENCIIMRESFGLKKWKTEITKIIRSVLER